jgi:hypothetical protein
MKDVAFFDFRLKKIKSFVPFCNFVNFAVNLVIDKRAHSR